MLVAAAVCPNPPLIVPSLAGAASAELDPLRAACFAAVEVLHSASPDLIAVVGGAENGRAYPPSAAGTLRPWGGDVTVGSGVPVLPLSLTIGRWLLSSSEVPLHLESVRYDATPDACRDLGSRVGELAGRVALLVMGDGSARLTEKSPGYLHPGAVAYSDRVVSALVEGRAATLDPAEAEEQWAAGRAAFQTLPDRPLDLLYSDAPYGVAYYVAAARFGTGTRIRSLATTMSPE
ncbi:class III extradiol ring-cleavage dioxygenase family protein [Herbidospora sp. RD11066]